MNQYQPHVNGAPDWKTSQFQKLNEMIDYNNRQLQGQDRALLPDLIQWTSVVVSVLIYSPERPVIQFENIFKKIGLELFQFAQQFKFCLPQDVS